MQAVKSSQPSDFAEFRAGWRVVAAAAIGTACGASPVPFQMIGPIAKPLNEAFGWARADVMLALLFFTLAVVLVVPVIGGLADRYGVRRVALVSTLLFGLTLMSLALVHSLLAFYLCFVAIGALGAGSTPVTWTRAVNGYFVRRRGLALALTLTGTGIAAFLVPRLAVELVALGSWRYAPLGLALLPLLIALPLAWFWFHEVSTRNTEQSAVLQQAGASGRTLREALIDYRFWLLGVSILMIAIGVGGSITNFVPMLTDKNFDDKSAASIAGVIGVSIILGRILAGYLIDHFWAPLVALPMLALPAIACVLLSASALSTTQAIFCAALIGLCAGAEADLIAYLCAKYFGLRHYGKIYGVQYAIFGLGSGVSPFVFGKVYDLYGSYAPILQVSAVLFVLGALLLLALGRYPQGR